MLTTLFVEDGWNWSQPDGLYAHLKQIALELVRVWNAKDPSSNHSVAPSWAAFLRELLPAAALVTPNLPEASLLAGFPIRGEADAKRAARAIQAAPVLPVKARYPVDMHAPLTQAAPAPQLLPHVPQFEGSKAVFVQTPLHAAWPAAHVRVHVLPTHAVPEAQV